MTPQIILASASPRRQELLQQINVRYQLLPVDIDETPVLSEQPEHYVLRMAAEKSMACIHKHGPTLPVLAADTAVVIGSRILGKPKNREDALAMLALLSGTTHLVYSAVSLRASEHLQAISSTEVRFKTLTNAEIESYWESGEPVDKAGAYAIQGLGSVFVEAIKGSFSGVVGLPLFETAALLSRLGIKIF